jgi:ABC-type polysaccharide/polyol phosphate export permease
MTYIMEHTINSKGANMIELLSLIIFLICIIWGAEYMRKNNSSKKILLLNLIIYIIAFSIWTSLILSWLCHFINK